MIIADCRKDPSILGVLCKRLETHLAQRFELDAVGITLSARVTGTTCDEEAAVAALVRTPSVISEAPAASVELDQQITAPAADEPGSVARTVVRARKSSASTDPQRQTDRRR